MKDEWDGIDDEAMREWRAFVEAQEDLWFKNHDIFDTTDELRRFAADVCYQLSDGFEVEIDDGPEVYSVARLYQHGRLVATVNDLCDLDAYTVDAREREARERRRML
jgi:hypothetical protein